MLHGFIRINEKFDLEIVMSAALKELINNNFHCAHAQAGMDMKPNFFTRYPATKKVFCALIIHGRSSWPTNRARSLQQQRNWLETEFAGAVFALAHNRGVEQTGLKEAFGYEDNAQWVMCTVSLRGDGRLQIRPALVDFWTN
jgi:hypothetical protein